MGSLALMPVGYLLAGPAAEALGAQRVMAVGGVLGALAMVLALLPRSTRDLTRWEHSPAPEGVLTAAVVSAAP